jgi:hypothetical protein
MIQRGQEFGFPKQRYGLTPVRVDELQRKEAIQHPVADKHDHTEGSLTQDSLRFIAIQESQGGRKDGFVLHDSGFPA